MKLPWTKPKPVVLDVFEYEPYAFEPGRVYVIEIDESVIHQITIQQLSQYFNKHGVNVALVSTRNGKALRPMNVKRMTREAR